MKKLLLTIAALLFAAPAVQAQVPDGPYRSSCINIKVVGNDLVAACRMGGNAHAYNNTVLFLPCNGLVSVNAEANLTCNGVPGPAWSAYANYVALTINGSGAVSTNDGGSCDKACTLMLKSGYKTFSATPASQGYVFDSWDGDCKGTAGNVCYLDMSLPHRLTANFRVAQATTSQHTLSVAPALHGAIVDVGTGGRFVHCSQADIQHCSATVDGGALIQLYTVPDQGYQMSAWGGDCSYSQRATCALPMSADRRVSATFVASGTAPVHAPVSPPSAAQAN